MILSIVSAVVIFAILIIVHEAGHFFMAKRMGVRVLRFSIGYPPRLFGIRRGETDYSLGATPLGGYVKMLGDEIAEEPSAETIAGYLGELRLDLLEAARRHGTLDRLGKSDDDALAALAEEYRAQQNQTPAFAGAAGNAALPAALADEPPDNGRALFGREVTSAEAILLREVAKSVTVKLAIEKLANLKPAALLSAFNSRAFPSQKLSRRFAIVLAGPAANIIFAPLLMIAVFMLGVPTTLPVLGTVKQDMPGYAAGLRPGDHVTAVDGKPIATWDELSRAVKDSGGHRLEISVDRTENGASVPIKIEAQPKLETEQTIYGNEAPTWILGVMPRGDEAIRKFPPLQAISTGVLETVRMTGALFVGIGKIISGATPVRQALGGPIMIAQMAGKEAHQGFADLALFMVMLSLELGIINLLPVPLLDGGHLLFFVIEGIKGEPLKLRHREVAMQIGLFLLAILMAFVILNDISRLIG
jgi:regulator of sigma E protease